MPKISERVGHLGTENAFVVLAEVRELIRKGKDIKSFCIGQPDFDTPKNIKKAAIKAIEEGKTGYTPSAGIMAARTAVADFFKRTRHIDVDPDSVVIANGAKPFIMYTIASVTDYGKGHEVLYPNPGFPIYSSQIMANGAVPVALPLLESKKFCFDIDHLEESISKKSRLLLLNSPQNPTGGILTKKELKRIADIVLNHDDLWVYSDEVYSKMCYDSEFASIASIEEMQERTVMVDGLSKGYAMTGWRMGFASCPLLAKHLSTWMTNSDSCPAHPTQYACIEALDGPQDESDKMVSRFKERRDLIVTGLNSIEGIRCLSPGGAFYAYPNVTEACKRLGLSNAEEFRKKLLHEADVAVLSDIHFGLRVKGEGQHIRLSYAASIEDIKEGIERIRRIVED